MATIKKTSNNTWVKRWRKRNPHILLVGILSSKTSMENSMKAPPKTKNKTTV
jgi:hypothetical protein